MYIKKTYKCGRVIEVHKTYSGRYGKRIPRSKNQNPSPEAVQKNNEREARASLARLINANYNPGDIHLVLTYRPDCRPDQEGARKLLENFHRRAKKVYERAGMEYKYIAVTEYESRAIHHHLVIPYIDMKKLLPIWPYGKLRPTYLDDTGDYTELANYLIKETCKTFRKKDAPAKKRWCCSRNLIHPQPKVEIIQAEKWREQPVAIKGYNLVVDSIESDVNPVTGIPYQRYRMIQISHDKRGP